MEKCVFCGKELNRGSGLMVVETDATIKYFCGSKCERNSNIRNPRKVKWTEVYHKETKPKNVK